VPEKISRTVRNAKRIHLRRRSPDYWRMMLDHPPLNITER
jgi:hypothetical protein